MPCPSKWPLPTVFCLLDNCVGWVRGVGYLVCFSGYQPVSRWGLCEKDQWCSAPVRARSFLLPPYAQPSPSAVPGLSLLAQGSLLTRAYSASSCSLRTCFPPNRHWSQASELTWTWLIQFRASQSLQSMLSPHAPSTCKNSTCTLQKQSSHPQALCWATALSLHLSSEVFLTCCIPLLVQQDSLDMSCTFECYNDGMNCFLPEKQGSKRRKKPMNTQPWNKLVSWLRCVAWHNCFMQKLVKCEYQNILFNQA